MKTDCIAVTQIPIKNGYSWFYHKTVYEILKERISIHKIGVWKLKQIKYKG